MSLQNRGYSENYPICANDRLVRRDVFRDIDEQAAQLLGHDQFYQQISAGSFRGEFATAALGENGWLFIEETNQALLQHGSTPDEQCSFMFLLADDGWCKFQGADFTSRDLALLAGKSGYSVRCPPGSKFCVITLEKAALEDEFAVENVRFDSACRLYSPQMELIVGALRSLVRTSFSMLDASNETSARENTLVNLRRALVSTLGLALSNDVGGAILSDRRLFSRACEIIDTSLGEIDVIALCRMLGVPRRTLESTFQKELGMGPARYIKTLRLNQIRREIRSGEKPDRSLADIAASWGLWHPSHFSESYGAMFGERPSQSRPNMLTQNHEISSRS